MVLLIVVCDAEDAKIAEVLILGVDIVMVNSADLFDVEL